MSDSDVGSKNIQIFTKNHSIIIIIDTDIAPTDNAFQNKELYQKDGVDYILFQRATEYKYGAYCNVDNCAYTIQTKTYEDLIYIIDNMEEK